MHCSAPRPATSIPVPFKPSPPSRRAAASTNGVSDTAPPSAKRREASSPTRPRQLSAVKPSMYSGPLPVSMRARLRSPRAANSIPPGPGSA